jgi:hypothetical protein
MSESFLSFGNSELFRKQLLVRNLVPYSVPGAYTSPGNPINYETTLTVSNVVDSPNNYVSTNLFANDLYPLNEYGPEGGFSTPIGVNVTPVLNPNQGPYQPNDTVLDVINEFYIESAYVTNKWGPSGGYKDLVVITDLQNAGNIYQPYWDPGYYSYSSYPTFNIVFQNDPIGSNGPLSSDSFIAQIGASQLKFAFDERVAQELQQATVGVINLDTITDPFSASLLATGQQPFFIRDWKITVPENPVLAAISLGNRLTGTYFPVSFIPGDYFDDDNPINKPQTEAALGISNSLTGGLLAPIMNKYRNPSEIFVANTGNGQRSALFSALDYNLYRPAYNRGVIGGLIAGASAAVNRLFDQDKAQSSGYYVGSENAEPSQIDGPPNQLPVNQFGVQQQSNVYGPQELGILYEGNEEKIKFGLKGKSYTDGGGTSGQLVWTSPKYKPNAGFRATEGGGAGSLDDEFNQISADYLQYQSTDVEFKPGSILYETQQLVNSADQVQGQTRLKHVGTAINQVSKVFNDGYKELTKGSRVLSYVNQADGTQAGLEYCRVFQKDTPYYTYADLQKTDGITTSGRKFEYSVFDNTYNLNIAPLKNPGSTNIVDGRVKKYMLSIENLAWRTSDRPGFTYDELPVCEKGPNGGRIMWFPPYNLSYSDTPSVTFNSTDFLGRPEPIYTYKNSSRAGSIGFTILVDHPSVMNTVIEKQMNGATKERVQSIIDSFFAGCTKYDMYDLAAKFNTIPTKDLYTYQQILNNPRLTSEEQVQVLESIPVDQTNTNSNNSSGADTNSNTTGEGTQTQDNTPPDYNWSSYEGLGFYFENDVPGGPNGTKPGENKTLGTSASNFDVYYNQYIGLKSTYNTKAPQFVNSNGEIFNKAAIPNFFSEVIEGNFNTVQNDLMKQIDDVLVKRKGSITLEMLGSASAPQEKAYNVKLSERRNDSVKKWFLAYKLSDNQTIQQYGDKFKMTLNAQGEETVIPQTRAIASGTPETNDISVTNSKGGDILSASINCTVNSFAVTNKGVKIPDQTTPTEAQWYSVPAMACRRVVIQKITAVIPPNPVEPTPPPVVEDDTNNPANSLTAITQSIKPEAKITIQQKLKEGISKKILRNLFSECDYFEVIKQSDPMMYESIKDQIKFFSPAFHSMTPEGLNARVTFLNQCTRPGQTIPIIGPDGRPKYNDALNTSFGAPPILIIRVGDFYHCKAVPTTMSLTNKTPLLDINPEGIGLQPMMVDVTINFNIIGGMGLKGPVDEIQNALSFNYYANTEIYDERATATDVGSAEKNDKYVIEKLNGGLPPVTQEQQAQINSVQPKKGGSTIGQITTETEIDYTTLYDSLQTKTQEYFKTSFESLQKLSTDYSYGLMQLSLKDSDYVEGEISEYTDNKKDLKLIGKSNSYLDFVEKLKERIIKDIKQEEDPIYDGLTSAVKSNTTGKQKRELQERLQTLVNDQQTKALDSIKNGTTNIINVQNELNFIFRQLDVVSSKLDGLLFETNEPKLYDLSGDTFFSVSPNSGSIFDVYTTSLKKIFDDYNKLLNDTNITKDLYNKKESVVSTNDSCSFVGSATGNNNEYWSKCPYNRFGVYMTPEFLNSDSFTKLKNYLTEGPEIKTNSDLVEGIKNSCDNFKSKCKEFQSFVKTTYFDDVEGNQRYKDATTWKIPDNTIKTCSYITPAEGDINQKTKRIKDLYSNINLNDKKGTFNGKVTLN